MGLKQEEVMGAANLNVIAMYLPQFHRVKENDEWWGEGFTEWTTVKAAKPLYEGHNQPVVPYNENYYDLSERATMQWQADLMKQYGIDGVCMYHYWFKDGQQILEKPAENLLQWKEIDMPFCFCWANETWARTWSGIQDANVWAGSFEKKTDDGKSILLEQKYGTQKEWAEHFTYLLNFFNDDRYIKIDGKPVFMIYRPELMPCTERMLELWNELARQEGFPGLYFICGNCGDCFGIHDAVFDKVLLWEPGIAIRQLKREECCEKKNGVLVVQGEDVWNKILRAPKVNSKTSFGGFVNYDDTPRRGNNGILVEGISPEKLEGYLVELLAKNNAAGNEYVFLNAWNEWGEGMYLEPNQTNGDRYLCAVKNAKKSYAKYVEKYVAFHNEPLKVSTNTTEGRYKHYYTILDKWLELRDRNVSLEEYFVRQGYNNIALYGYGNLAKHLVAELNGSRVNVKYIIDRKPENVHGRMSVYSPDDKLPSVDAVIITATFSCGSIFAALKNRGIKNIISLEEIITELV